MSLPGRLFFPISKEGSTMSFFRFLHGRARAALAVLLIPALLLLPLTFASCGAGDGPQTSASVSFSFSLDAESDPSEAPSADASEAGPVSGPDDPSDAPSEEEPSFEPSSDASESAVVEEGTVLYRSLSLPDSSATVSHLLATQMLGFCSLGSESIAAFLLESSGFELVFTSGFDKSPADDSHTCAFAVGKGTILYKGKLRTVFLIAIRGTQDAEWLSNFDFAPSHSNDTAYAENFLACADDVLSKTEDLLRAESDPLIAVCGHSRGAACANLVGVRLNQTFPSENVFVYTFATPTTVREAYGFDNSPHRNIFNYLNPCDIVTHVPLEAWGFGRAGTDIVLDADEAEVRRVKEAIAAFLPVAPTISDYYNVKHPLSSKDKNGESMTTYEIMKQLTGLFGNTYSPLQGALARVDKNGAYYPLITFFTGRTDSGGLSVSILMQHMPATYMLAIQKLIPAS